MTIPARRVKKKQIAVGIALTCSFLLWAGYRLVWALPVPEFLRPAKPYRVLFSRRILKSTPEPHISVVLDSLSNYESSYYLRLQCPGNAEVVAEELSTLYKGRVDTNFLFSTQSPLEHVKRGEAYHDQLTGGIWPRPTPIIADRGLGWFYTETEASQCTLYCWQVDDHTVVEIFLFRWGHLD